MVEQRGMEVFSWYAHFHIGSNDSLTVGIDARYHSSFIFNHVIGRPRQCGGTLHLGSCSRSEKGWIAIPSMEALASSQPYG